MRHGADHLRGGEILFWLARRVHFGDDHFVRILEGAGKIQEESSGCASRCAAARPPRCRCSGIAGARSCERCLDLGGMVGIVIKDADAVHLAAQLEAPPGAGELAQGAGRLISGSPSTSAIARTASALRTLCLPGICSETSTELSPALPGWRKRQSHIRRAGWAVLPAPSPTAGC